MNEPAAMNVTTGKRGTQPVLTGGVYLVLFVLGAVEGLIGSFQYSRMAGSVPLAAIAFCLALLVTCLLARWGMRSASGALVPAIGWPMRRLPRSRARIRVKAGVKQFHYRLVRATVETRVVYRAVAVVTQPSSDRKSVV